MLNATQIARIDVVLVVKDTLGIFRKNESTFERESEKRVLRAF